MALPLANTAKYELVLPSQQKTVSFRPFLVKEEKILLMAMESGNAKEILNSVKDIVKSCTFDAINPDDHPMFDIEYVFLQIRSKSVGEIQKIRILCPDDKKTYGDVEIDLSKVEVFVDDDHTNKIILDEQRQLGVVMKYPSMKDVDEDMVAGDIKLESMYSMLTNAIESIFEGDKVYLAKDSTKEELREFVDNLTSDQMKKLNAFYNTMPRLEQKVIVKNPKTGIENEVTLKGLADFFG